MVVTASICQGSTSLHFVVHCNQIQVEIKGGVGHCSMFNCVFDELKKANFNCSVVVQSDPSGRQGWGKTLYNV